MDVVGGERLGPFVPPGHHPAGSRPVRPGRAPEGARLLDRRGRAAGDVRRAAGGRPGPLADPTAGGTDFRTAAEQDLPRPEPVSGDHTPRRAATDDTYGKVIDVDEMWTVWGIPGWLVSFGIGFAVLAIKGVAVAIVLRRNAKRQLPPLPPPGAFPPPGVYPAPGGYAPPPGAYPQPGPFPAPGAAMPGAPMPPGPHPQAPAAPADPKSGPID